MLGKVGRSIARKSAKPATALPTMASMLLLGCSHTLTFNEGRYEVWVSPLTAKAHVLEETNINGLPVLIDRTIVPYEWRGDLNIAFGIWPSGQGYANVMVTLFARIKGRQFAARELGSIDGDLGLAATLSPYGFQCGPPRHDTAVDLTGIALECSTTRMHEQQRMRIRCLFGQEGLLMQVVTWTDGSKAAGSAEKFWHSIQLGKAFQGPKGGGPAVDIAELPMNALLSRALTIQGQRSD